MVKAIFETNNLLTSALKSKNNLHLLTTKMRILLNRTFRAKADHFISVLRGAHTTYFWTSGNVNHGQRQVTWGNGASQAFNQIAYWSHTGG